MFYRIVFSAYTFLVTTCAVGYAGTGATVGDSHNRIDAVGRNRANVIYTTAKAATQTEIKQPIVQPDTPNANDMDIIETDMPTPEQQSDERPDLTADIAAATEYITHLQNEITQIDSEIARCKKTKNNWIIGTVVGSVGVVGTATGAIVQAVKINKAKKNGATESATDDDKDAKESE